MFKKVRGGIPPGALVSRTAANGEVLFILPHQGLLPGRQQGRQPWDIGPPMPEAVNLTAPVPVYKTTQKELAAWLVINWRAPTTK
jgi:hypothetical protein